MLGYLFLNEKQQPYSDPEKLGGGIWFTLNKSLAKAVARSVSEKFNVTVVASELDLQVFAHYLREHKLANIVRVERMNDTGFLTTALSVEKYISG
jgi:hypothetical protein